jgi:hypothetical protein
MMLTGIAADGNLTATPSQCDTGGETDFQIPNASKAINSKISRANNTPRARV